MQRISRFCILLFLALAACQGRPDYVIDEASMTELLTDVHEAEGLIDLQQTKAKESEDYGQQVMAAVLEKHHVSKAQYDTSLVWYSQNLTSLIRIYKHVNENLAERETKWTELANASGAFGTSPSGDSVNLWIQSPYLVLDESRLSHIKIWTIQTDSTFYMGDTLRWRLHVPDLPKGERLVASLSLLKEDPGNHEMTILDGMTSSQLFQDTILELSCVGAEDKEFSQVMATLHLLNKDSISMTLLPCVVDGFQLIRIHRKN